MVRVSSFFHDVAAVGRIELQTGPLGGHFLWPEPAADAVLLIGAGSGLVPLMAMIRQRHALRKRCRQRCSSPHEPQGRSLLGRASFDRIQRSGLPHGIGNHAGAAGPQLGLWATGRRRHGPGDPGSARPNACTRIRLWIQRLRQYRDGCGSSGWPGCLQCQNRALRRLVGGSKSGSLGLDVQPRIQSERSLRWQRQLAGSVFEEAQTDSPVRANGVQRNSPWTRCTRVSAS